MAILLVGVRLSDYDYGRLMGEACRRSTYTMEMATGKEQTPEGWDMEEIAQLWEATSQEYKDGYRDGYLDAS